MGLVGPQAPWPQNWFKTCSITLVKDKESLYITDKGALLRWLQGRVVRTLFKVSAPVLLIGDWLAAPSWGVQVSQDLPTVGEAFLVLGESHGWWGLHGCTLRLTVAGGRLGVLLRPPRGWRANFLRG